MNIPLILLLVINIGTQFILLISIAIKPIKNEISGHILQKLDWGYCQLDLHKGPANNSCERKYYLPSKFSA